MADPIKKRSAMQEHTELLRKEREKRQGEKGRGLLPNILTGAQFTEGMVWQGGIPLDHYKNLGIPSAEGKEFAPHLTKLSAYEGLRLDA